MTKNEEDEKAICYIKLGRTDKTAKIYKEDYEELLKLGVSTSWHHGALGYISCYCKGIPGSRVNIARVLMDAGAQETVRFRDGDKCNLLKDNLVKMHDAKATRKAREYLTPRAVAEGKSVGPGSASEHEECNKEAA